MVGQHACTLLPLSLEKRAQMASLIIEGKVVSQQSFWDSKRENIYTSNKVEVYKIFKGETAPEVVEIITEGGRVGLDLHVYSATLSLKEQQQGIFFLQASNKPGSKKAFEAYGSLQGYIQYRLSQGTAKDPFQEYSSILREVYPALTKLTGSTYRIVRNNTALEALTKPKESNQTLRRQIPLITSFSPATLRAGTGDVLTISGTNFGTTQGSGYVEFKNADDGGDSYIQPLPTDYVSWTNTEIKVKVPSNGIDFGTAGSGTFRVVNSDPNTATSPGILTIIYAVSNVSYEDQDRNIKEQSFIPRLIDQDGEGGYTFRFGANFEANKPALYAFKRSMNEWSCNTFINWNTVNNAAIARTADDEVNSVRFATSGELPANVLGRCISRYSGCITGGTTLNFWVSEMDLEFAFRADWQYGPGSAGPNQFDFESVVLHELGHGHQLSHLILPRAVMHYAVARAQQSRELSPISDIAGGLYVMDKSVGVNVCNVDPIVPKPEDNCAITVQPLALQAEYRPSDNTVLLQWETVYELNVTEFIVERSLNGVDYTAIGTVPATGSATSGQTYQFVDPDPAPVLAYYRLRQVVPSGRTEFSEVAEVRGPSFTIQLAPNPGGSTTYLYYSATQSERLTIDVFDTVGRLHASFIILAVPSTSRYEVPLPNIGRGLFLFRWQGSKENGVLRYLKVE